MMNAGLRMKIQCRVGRLTPTGNYEITRIGIRRQIAKYAMDILVGRIYLNWNNFLSNGFKEDTAFILKCNGTEQEIKKIKEFYTPVNKQLNWCY